MRFNILWKYGEYRVSVPRYEGGAVVTADEVAELERQLAAEREARQKAEQAEARLESLRTQAHSFMVNGHGCALCGGEREDVIHRGLPCQIRDANARNAELTERVKVLEGVLDSARREMEKCMVCPTCDGTGKVEWECGPCLAGDGTPCEKSQHEIVDCPQCDGTGKDWHGNDPKPLIAALNPPAKGAAPADERCLCSGVGCNSCERQGRG